MGQKITTPPPSNVNISDNSLISNIVQVDGLDNVDSSSEHDSNDSDNSDTSNVTEYNTEDEIDADVTPISITPQRKANKREMQILSASSLMLEPI